MQVRLRDYVHPGTASTRRRPPSRRDRRPRPKRPRTLTRAPNHRDRLDETGPPHSTRPETAPLSSRTHRPSPPPSHRAPRRQDADPPLATTEPLPRAAAHTDPRPHSHRTPRRLGRRSPHSPRPETPPPRTTYTSPRASGTATISRPPHPHPHPCPHPHPHPHRTPEAHHPHPHRAPRPTRTKRAARMPATARRPSHQPPARTHPTPAPHRGAPRTPATPPPCP